MKLFSSVYNDGGEGSLVCVFNTVGDGKSVSFTVHVYLIDVELDEDFRQPL